MSGRGNGWVVLVGGSGPEGMSRRPIRRFVDLAGGPDDARVVVVPTASEQHRETIDAYVNAFELADAQHIEVLDIRTHGQARQPETLRTLHAATGIIFTGGDQLRLLSILGGTPFAAELRRRHAHEGLVVGGSSAGAMALGDPVIVRGEPTEFYAPDAIEQMPGLGLLQGATIDTHLIARGRLARVVPVLATRPDVLGLGLEEGCGLVVSPERVATVLGDGIVCVVDAAAASGHAAAAHRALSVSGLALHVLADGDTFDLRTRRVVHHNQEH